MKRYPGNVFKKRNSPVLRQSRINETARKRFCECKSQQQLKPFMRAQQNRPCVTSTRGNERRRYGGFSSHVLTTDTQQTVLRPMLVKPWHRTMVRIFAKQRNVFVTVQRARKKFRFPLGQRKLIGENWTYSLEAENRKKIKYVGAYTITRR